MWALDEPQLQMILIHVQVAHAQAKLVLKKVPGSSWIYAAKVAQDVADFNLSVDRNKSPDVTVRG